MKFKVGDKVICTTEEGIYPHTQSETIKAGRIYTVKEVKLRAGRRNETAIGLVECRYTYYDNRFEKVDQLPEDLFTL